MEIPESWIAEITNQFNPTPPNGFALDWDSDRYFAALKKLCVGCTVLNCTDFNYAYCNTFRITPKSINREYVYDLTLNISFIVNGYSLHWTKSKQGSRAPTPIKEEHIKVKMNPAPVLRQYMDKNSFIEVDGSWFDLPIKGVQLELAEIATLGKCLFHDC